MELRRIKFVNKHRTSVSRVATIAALVFTVTAASYFSHRTHGDYGDYTLAAGPGLDGPDIELLEQQNKAFERIIQATAPAVVYISAE
jgi:hypothetical protein